MSVANILAEAGLVPVVPEARKGTGTLPAFAPQRVPVVPEVPVRNHRGTRVEAGIDDMRARLLSLADRALVAPELVRRIPAADLRTLIEVATGDAWLMSYLHGIGTLAELRSGRLPLEYDTPARCTHCGPVWLPAATVAGLDAAGGLPLVHGCPWCFVTLPKGMGIPRPIYPRSEP